VLTRVEEKTVKSAAKKASIISIGNEIITGHIVDTNAAYLSASLIDNGIPTVGVHQIGDDVEVIASTIRQTAEVSDIILLTGGLGPTDDDVTREALARYLDTKLELRSNLLQELEKFFEKRSIAMPEINKRQAYVPIGTEPMPNSLGTAPGILAKCEGKIIAAMPGVPSEMKRMFENYVMPELKKESSGMVILIRKLKCFGTGESTLVQKLGDMMARDRNPQINCTVSYGVITLHIVATAKDKTHAQQMVERDEQILKGLLGELVYGVEEQTLAQVVGERLAEQKKTLTVAESCTGGLLGKLITDVPGSSRYFVGGWITYSNKAKIAELGVPAETIGRCGAVSAEVATAMAEGARQRARTDYAISITGIAGPEGGSEQKPVGLVYIGVASAQDCSVQRFIFPPDRELIRLRAAQTALNVLRLKMRI
jgi:nicotinamide-nucleotide amidase